MADTNSFARPDAFRLILIPSAITLAVTLLRLTGELRHWSPIWFSTETGGTTPQGVSWVVGITWLAAPLGIYFAFKLVKARQGPGSMQKSLALAALGLLILVEFRFLIRFIPLQFPSILIPLWLLMSVAAALQYFGWPELFKTLLIYGFAARIPVVLVMLLAMLGRWGTHYDYVGMPARFEMPLIQKFFWLAFFPQLIFWVAFTIVVGAICGTLAAALIRFKPSMEHVDLGC